MTLPSLDWNVEGLRAAMAPWLPGIEIDVVATLASTNTALLDHLREGAQASADMGADTRAQTLADDAPSFAMRRRSVESRAFHRRAPDRAPRLLAAESQTAGRGRQGRAWHADAGASLTFSLAVPIRRADLSGLSLAIGVVLAEALDPESPRTPGRIGIKWPNDLWLLDAPVEGHPTPDPSHAVARARKLGGILIEAVTAHGQRWAVIGIGINIHPVDAPGATSGVAALSEFVQETGPARGRGTGDPSDTATPMDTDTDVDFASGTTIHTGVDGDSSAEITAPRTLARIVRPLAEAIAAFERDGYAAFAARYAERDLLQGLAIITTSPEAPEGIASGVDERGALRVETLAGLRLLHGGEVSVRPRRVLEADGGAASSC